MVRGKSIQRETPPQGSRWSEAEDGEASGGLAEVSPPSPSKGPEDHVASGAIIYGAPPSHFVGDSEPTEEDRQAVLRFKADLGGNEAYEEARCLGTITSAWYHAWAKHSYHPPPGTIPKPQAPAQEL